MNRCNSRTPGLPFSFLPLALCLLLPVVAAVWTAGAHAQTDIPPTQNEALAGGRNFPIGTLRGKLMVVNPPDVRLDDQADRLAPGVRLRSAQNMAVMASTVVGQNLLVNYTRDAAGLVRDVWILTPDEARTERASVERPLLNFWPFVAAPGPRDDGKTPFNQLPKFGE